MDVETAELIALQACKDRTLAYWTNFPERVNTMQIVVAHTRKAFNLKRKINNRRHRQWHIELANKIRSEAEQWRTQAMMEFPEREAEIIVAYDKMMTEALAEENRKCMERNH